MGKPGRGQARSLRSEHIGPVESTWGIETSQYPEEKKAISDSLSSGERNGKSPNLCSLIARWRCCIGVVGPMPLRTGAELELQSRRLVEHSWKAGPQGVTAP